MPNDLPVSNFKVARVPKSGFLDRIRGRSSREAAFVKIRNLLASKPWVDIRGAEITSLLAGSKVSRRQVSPELLGIYEHAVQVLARDLELDDADRMGLKNLQGAFDLTDAEASTATRSAVGHLFTKAMREALSDGAFTEEERGRLERLAKSLGITPNQAQEIQEAAAAVAVQSAFDTSVADQRYTADEEARVMALARALGANVQHDPRTTALLARYRLLAEVDAGRLPEVTPSIRLQRGEVCHFNIENVIHKELRTVTKRVNYSGPTASFRIMKGVRWRIGSIAAERVTQDILTEIDAVELYLTNKRVFLRGNRKNSSIALSKIAHFTVFSDGLQLEKQTGKDVYLVGLADWELAGACLNSSLNAAR